MAGPGLYLVAWIRGLFGAIPFINLIIPPGNHWDYLAEKTTGTDPVTGLSAQDYKKKAESTLSRTNNAVMAFALGFVYIFKYSFVDQPRLWFWAVKSVAS